MAAVMVLSMFAVLNKGILVPGAEASSGGNYNITIWFDVYDTDGKSDFMTVTLTGVDQSGSSGTILNGQRYEDYGRSSSYTHTYSSQYLPTAISVHWECDSCDYSDFGARVYVYVTNNGQQELMCASLSDHTDDTGDHRYSCDGSASYGDTPKVSSVSITGGANQTISGGYHATLTSSAISARAYDQFGVEWYQYPTWSKSADTISTTSNSASVTLTSTSYSDHSTTVTASLGGKSAATTVTFRWKHRLTVTNAGNGTSGTFDDYNGATKALSAGSRTGYTFSSWTKGGTGSLSSTTSATPTWTFGNGDGTATANWTIHSFNVALTAGTGISAVSGGGTKNYGSSVTASATVKNGYTFSGWSGTSSSTSNPYTFTMPDNAVNLTATATRDTYTIGYTLNGGSVSGTNPTSYHVESSAITLINPTRTGYVFTGWSGTGINGTSTSVTIPTGSTGNRSYTANWRPNAFTVAYNGNSNTSGSAPANQTKYYDTALTLAGNSGNLARNGYTFAGWNTKADGTGTDYAAGGSIAATAQPKNDGETLTLYAKWTKNPYTITFDADGGEAVSAIPYDIESTGTLPSTSKTGYTFAGWKPTSSVGSWSNSATYASGTSLTGKWGTVTLKAQWTKNSYTITYDAKGGAAVAQKSYDIESTDTLPSTTRDGYAFAGWKPASNSGSWSTSATYGAGDPLTGKYGDVTLEAQWSKNPYTITFDADGGDAVSAVDYDIESTATLPATSKTGYTFGGWKPTSTVGSWSNSETYASGTSLTGKWGTVTLKAQWTPNTYTVAYAANKPAGASNEVTGVPAAQTKTYGADLTLQSGTPSLTGWTFKGWNTKADGTGTPYSAGVTMSADHASAQDDTVTLYALWEVNTYTVAYAANKPAGASNEVTGVPESQTKTYDTDLTLRSGEPALTGWKFTGWNTAADGNGTPYAEGATMSADHASAQDDTVTLYAQWTANEYTIAYDGNKPSGATGTVENIPAAQTKTYDTPLTLASGEPALTGWKFLCWNTAADGNGVDYDAGASLTTDYVSAQGATVTLYAKWASLTYTIAYDGNKPAGASGSVSDVPEAQTKIYDTPLALDAGEPALTGWTFGGWNTAANGSGDDYAAGATLSTDLASTQDAVVTLYAKWTANTYTVNYSGNKPAGASGDVSGVPAAQTKTYDTALSLASGEPALAGWTFEGWYTAADCSGVGYEAGATLTADLTSENNGSVTLYAKWTANPYTIAYNGNGATGGSTASTPAVYDADVTLAANGYTREYTVSYEERGGNALTDTVSVYGKSGWNTAADYSGTNYNEEQTLSRPNFVTSGIVTLHAHWTPTEIALETATRTGYIFGGWAVSADDAEAKIKTYDGGQRITPTADMTLYAIWTPITYTVAFDANGGSGAAMTPMSFTYDEAQNLTDNHFSRTGYTFLGWSTDSGAAAETYGNQASVSNLTAVDGDTVTLYAIWSANSFTVRFDGNGATGGSMADQDFVYGEAENLTANAFSRTGYEFTGWLNGSTPVADEADGSTLTDVDGATVTLKAQWTPITYTVKYDGNSATSGSVADQTMTYDQTVALNANNFVKTYDVYYNINYGGSGNVKLVSAYDFDGWTGEDGNDYTDEQEVSNLTAVKNDEFTMTAKWSGGAVTLADLTGTRTGYTFKGWFDDPAAGNKVLDSGSYYPTANITLYAHWTPDTYTVSYNANGGTGTIADETATYDASFTLNSGEGFSKTGYTFDGWAETAGGDKVANTFTWNFTTDKTYYARWKANEYTVSYNANGGAGTIADETATYDAQFTLNSGALFSKTGYHFVGWSETEAGTTAVESPFTWQFTTDKEYFAIWVPDTYSVEYDANGGEGSYPDATATYDEDFDLPDGSALSKVGHTFRGWSLSNDNNQSGILPDPISPWNYTEGKTFHAVWEINSYTLKLINDAQTTETTVVYNAPITLNDVSKNGYTFNGWYTEANGAGTRYRNNDPMPAADLTLYASYTPIDYTITYILDGGAVDPAAPNPETYNIETPTFTLNNPEKTGFEFDGWKLGASDESEMIVTIEQGSTGNRIYTAKWRNIRYYFTYDLAGGTVSPANPEYYDVETPTITLNNPTRTGYDFTGWSGTDLTGENNMTVEIPTGSTGARSYTAHWRAHTYTVEFTADDKTGGSVPANVSATYDVEFTMPGSGDLKREYTVTFDANSGTVAPASSVAAYTFTNWKNGDDLYDAGTNYSNLTSEDLATVTMAAVWQSASVDLPTPVRDGYDFDGWYLGDSKVEGSTYTPVSDVTLIAHWTPIEYDISYDVANGSNAASNPATYTIEDDDIVLADPSRNGYTFLGWTGEGVTTPTKNVVIASGSIGDKSYVAVWEAITYSISYTLDDGTVEGTNPVEYNIESSAITLINPTKTGWDFAGWTGTGLEGQTMNVVIPTGSYGDRSYSATWSVHEYSITYDLAGGNLAAANPYEYTVLSDPITLNNPTRTGYTFAGWTGTELDEATDPVVIPTGSSGDRAYTATWTPVSYSIRFDGNGATSGEMADQSFTYDVSTALNANQFEREYTVSYNANGGSACASETAVYTFNRWNQNADNSYDVSYRDGAQILNLTSTADDVVTFYAQWNSDDVVLPATTRDGYTFGGWYSDEDLTQFVGNNGAKYVPTADIELYAKWEAIDYTVTYKANGGEGADVTRTVAFGSEFTVIDNPFTRNGYTFEGWATEPDAAAANFTSGTYSTVGNTVAYAVWAPVTYSIGYTLNDGTVEGTNPVEYTIESASITLINPTRTGYDFAGWTGTGLDEASETVTILTGSTGDREYTATWNAHEYSITYDLAGGELATANPDKYTVESSDIVLNNPTMTGYTFAGWTGTELDAATVNVTIATGSIGDRTYTATWAPVTYVVHFDKNDAEATGTMEDQTFTYDEAQALTANGFAKEGYSFIGWAESAGGEVVYTNGGSVSNLSTTADDVITLYAKWNVNGYTIRFNANGGTGTMNPQYFPYEPPQAINANTFERTGYKFSGWNTAADGSGDSYDDEQSIEKLTAVNEAIIDFYAQWTPVSYDITYIGVEGTTGAESNPSTYNIESAAITLAAPAKDGYTFVGWSGTDIDGTSMSVTVPTGSTGDREYTANFTQNITISTTGTTSVYDGEDIDATDLGLTVQTADSTDITASSSVSYRYAVGGRYTEGLPSDAGAYTIEITVAPNGNIEGGQTTVDYVITKRPVALNAAGVDKTYDGSSVMTVNFSLGDYISGDELGLSPTSDAAATADSANVGERRVTFTAPALTGSDASNYTLTVPEYATANISKRALTITASGADKVYDGTADIAVTLTAVDPVSGDVITITGATGTAQSANAGTWNVNIDTSSAVVEGAGNYEFTLPASTTATISKKALTITAAGTDKVYDGNTDIAVTMTATGMVEGETITVTGATGTANDANVGAKTVTIDNTNTALSGETANNYVCEFPGETTANITKANLTVTATAEPKVYDGNTDMTVTLTAAAPVAGNEITITGATGTADTKNVGTGKTVTINTDSVTVTGDGNYKLIYPASIDTGVITAKEVELIATGVNKTYDGNNVMTVNFSLGEYVSGDELGLSAASDTAATADSANIGTRTITFTAPTLTGTDKDNYELVVPENATAEITGKTATVTATATNKTYDGNGDITVTFTLTGIVDGDDAVLNTYTATGTTDKNVGTGKTVTFTAPYLTGANAGNYTINTVTETTVNITPLELTLEADGNDKVYDATRDITVDLTLSGMVAGDDVAIAGGNTVTGEASDKNVGNKVVTFAQPALTGDDAANYTLPALTSTSALITPASATVEAVGADKVYDGNTAINVTLTLTGIYDGDAVEIAGGNAIVGNTADANVEDNKTVTFAQPALTGADAGNYTVNEITTTTASITRKALTITAAGTDKEYDGTTAIEVTLTASGMVDDETVTITGATGAADDANVGDDKHVSIDNTYTNVEGAANYSYTLPTETTANITPKALTITAEPAEKVYDGTTAIDVTLTASGMVAGETVTVTGAKGTVEDKNVGDNWHVDIDNSATVLTGAGNYSYTLPTETTAKITPKPITVAVDGVDRAYERGNTTVDVVFTALGVVPGDSITFSATTGEMNDDAAGVDKFVAIASGTVVTGAENYSYTLPTETTVTIYNKDVHVMPVDTTKVYDGNTAVTVTFTTDDADITVDAYTAQTSSENVGSYTVAIDPASVTSNADANYNLVFDSVTAGATITPLAISVSGEGVDRDYNGTNAVSVNLTLTGALEGDDVYVESPTAATMTDAIVGDGKTATFAQPVLKGDDAGNYTVNALTSASVNITPAKLTLGATGVDKVYDGSTDITVLLTLTGTYGHDDVTLDCGSSTVGHTENANVGTNKAVTFTLPGLVGDDAANYEIYPVNTSTTASITARTLTITAAGTDKVYDGNADIAVTMTASGMVDGEEITVTGAKGTADDANVGDNKHVAINNDATAVTGETVGNYTYTLPTETTANITKAALTIEAVGADKVYDGNADIAVTLTASGMVNGDTVTITGAKGTANDKNVGAKTVAIDNTNTVVTGAENYSYTLPTETTANITARALEISAAGTDKVYDGNADIAVTLTAVDPVDGDVITITGAKGTANDANVGAKTVAIDNTNTVVAGAENYSYTLPTETTANITKAALTIEAAGTDKVYDGNADIAVTLTASGMVNGDTVTITGAKGTANDKNVGAKTVAIDNTNTVVAGAENYSYTLPDETTATITAKDVELIAEGVDKTYDGTDVMTVNFSLGEYVSGDDLSVEPASDTAATADSANVGARTIDFTAPVLAGTDKDNYNLVVPANASAEITGKTATVTATATPKTYDGNGHIEVAFTLTGIVDGDDAVLNTYTATGATDKTAGNGKTVTFTAPVLTGADAANYTLNTVSEALVDIYPLELTVSASGRSKVYDATKDITVDLTLSGMVAGDSVAIAGGNTTVGEAADKNVGNKDVTFAQPTLTGDDAANYTLNALTSTTASITPASARIDALGENKVYDGNTAINVGLSLTGIYDGDDVAIAGGDTVVGNTGDPDVGDNKTVTFAQPALTGDDAGNYTVNSITAATASIRPKTVVITATPVNRDYDGTTAVTVNFTAEGLVEGDGAQLSPTSVVGEAASKNAGTQAVSFEAPAIVLDGAPAANYTWNTVTEGRVVISKINASVSVTAAPRAYDGTTVVEISTSTEGFLDGDDIVVNASATGTADSKNAGSRTVIFDPITVTGADAVNYNITVDTQTTVEISKKTVTTTPSVSDKYYDGNDKFTVSFTAPDFVETDDVALVETVIGHADGANVGEHTVTFEAPALTGEDAVNYDLVIEDVTLTASILPADSDVSVAEGSLITITSHTPDPAQTGLILNIEVAADDGYHLDGNLTLTMGGEILTSGYSYTGVLGDRTATIVIGTVTGAVTVDAGTVECTYGYVAHNNGTHSKVCQICGYTEEADCEFSVVVTAPTCTLGGYTTHTCDYCGYSYVDGYTPATGHSWGAWTDNGNGTHSRVCANDPTHVQTKDHVWNSGVVTTAPTCTVDGVRTYTCADCGATYTEAVPAIGHNWDDGEIVYTWSAGYTKCTATLYCANNSAHTISETSVASVETDADGNATYTAEFDNPVFETQVKYVPNTQGGSHGNVCAYCGQVHTGFFGAISYFIHSILMIFRKLFG